MASIRKMMACSLLALFLAGCGSQSGLQRAEPKILDSLPRKNTFSNVDFYLKGNMEWIAHSPFSVRLPPDNAPYVCDDFACVSYDEIVAVHIRSMGPSIEGAGLLAGILIVALPVIALDSLQDIGASPPNETHSDLSTARAEADRIRVERALETIRSSKSGLRPASAVMLLSLQNPSDMMTSASTYFRMPE